MSADHPHDIHNPDYADSHADSPPRIPETAHQRGDDDDHDALLDELLPDSARDLLLSRIIDGRAGSADWDRFRAMAAREPESWAELGDFQRQHESLRHELSCAVSLADRVGLPAGVVDDTSTRQRLGFAGRWGGWAAAAALLLAWSMGTPSLPTGDDGSLPTQSAGLPGSGIAGIGLREAEPEQAFEQYLVAGQRSGRVVAEMPEQVVIETTPRADGSIEVLYLRQVIERRVIDRAYRRMHDEAGNTIAVPVRYEPRTNITY